MPSAYWIPKNSQNSIEQRQSETGIAAQLDRHAGKSGLQSRHQPQQHRNNAGMTGGIARSQPRGQQASGVTLEDEHGVVHMLAVGAVEDAELLLAMRGIVGGVDIQQDLAALADLLSTEANELIEQGVVQAHQVAGRRCILPAAERGLGAERFSQLLIGDDLQSGIMTQTVGIVGVFVAGDDLIDALPQQRQRVMAHPFIISRVAEQCGPIAGQMMPLVESAQRQQAGVAGDLAAGKITLNGTVAVEGEAEL